MIVLDTNIISELMKVHPDNVVTAWIDQQEASELHITTITIAEISYGIHALPNGNRRQTLESAFDKTLKLAFKHRILTFNEEAAHCYGNIMGQRKAMGKPLSILDGQIAAITSANHATLATRNSRDFMHCEVDIINPFNI